MSGSRILRAFIVPKPTQSFPAPVRRSRTLIDMINGIVTQFVSVFNVLIQYTNTLLNKITALKRQTMFQHAGYANFI